jgi:hypothetical protein
MGDIERTRPLFRRLWASRKPTAKVNDADSAIKGRHLRLLAVGHSHLQALIEAQTERIAAGRSNEESIQFIQLLEPEYNPNVRSDNGRWVLKEALAERLQRDLAIRDNRAQSIVDCVAGNEYHFIGLANHPRPFDFVLPTAPHLPLQPNAEIIPTTLITQTMRHALQYALAVLTALREATSLPIWHVQSPPPVPSEAHIMAHPTHFKDALKQYGVAPAVLRWKLWRLQSEIYLEACESQGISFLPTPPAAMDQDGFLVESGWNPDPTHANKWYGDLVLSQIAALHEQVETIA